jgi:prolipoprotein diacylglyceryltransferase
MKSYAEEPFWFFAGGIAIHGAVIGGILTGVVFSCVKNILFYIH